MIHGTQEFLPYLELSPEAHLINISSILGLIAAPGQSIYNLTKFAVRGYTEALRQELDGSNIHVTCVHPGFINTNIAKASVGENADHYREELERFDQLAKTSPESAATTIIQGMSSKKEGTVHNGHATGIFNVSFAFIIFKVPDFSIKFFWVFQQQVIMDEERGKIAVISLNIWGDDFFFIVPLLLWKLKEQSCAKNKKAGKYCKNIFEAHN